MLILLVYFLLKLLSVMIHAFQLVNFYIYFHLKCSCCYYKWAQQSDFHKISILRDVWRVVSKARNDVLIRFMVKKEKNHRLKRKNIVFCTDDLLQQKLNWRCHWHSWPPSLIWIVRLPIDKNIACASLFL
jgi:hypothetical protein